MDKFNLKKRYEIFIRLFNTQLLKMFENQQEFIKCEKGCSHCCEHGEYPFSRLEAEYLIYGYKKLPEEVKAKIKSNIKKLDKEKIKSDKQPFMYKCPMLIDNICSVYENRGIICRTFGLLCEKDDDKYTLPFCHELGLNYSNVYDEESGTIVDEKDGQKLCKTEPKAYRISRNHVMSLSMARNLDLDWGESKTLYDYLKEYNVENL